MGVFMILGLLIALPLLAALIVSQVRSPQGLKACLLVSTTLTLGGALFTRSHSLSMPWITSLGIQFKLGVDGLSWIMLLLTCGAFFFIALSSISSTPKNTSAFYALMLVTQAALIGVFTAQNMFLFYVFWELAILPAFFMLMGWGSEGKGAATIKFLLYSLAGSFCLLVPLLYLYTLTPIPHSFDLAAFSALSLSPMTQLWVFGSFFIAFAIKTPLVPFHTWQPGTYFKSSLLTTMVLAGVLSKMGIYGMLRLLPLAPAGFSQYGKGLIILCIVGILYASTIALAQYQFKRLIAFSSIAHMGLIVAGILTQTSQGVQGAMLQMVSHAISALGLLFIAQLIFTRTGTLETFQLGGIRKKSPFLAGGFLVILMGSIGLPFTNGFVGECLLLSGLFDVHPLFALFAGLSLIISAWYMLKLYQTVMLGKYMHPTEELPAFNLQISEKIALWLLITAVVGLGLFPQFILDAAAPVANAILHTGAIL